MAVIVNKKFWGLDCIIRHDYEDPEIQEKLKGYQKKSVDAFMHFLTNVPGFKYKSFLDVGCGDDYCINLVRDKFENVTGIEKYPGTDKNGNKIKYPDVLNLDWNDMAESPVFYAISHDAIFINHSLEHADNVYQLMQQVSYLQDKGDALFIAVPDGNTPFGYSITSSTTHFSCITEGYLLTTLQRFGYNVAIETREFRPGAKEIWAFAIKQYDSFPLGE